MFLNIITPCSRYELLREIEGSINIPRERYRWIVVYDSEKLPSNVYIPSNCEAYAIKNLFSVYGNAQRNYALNMVKDGYIYFNDDDTIIHKDLWDNVNYLHNDFISFSQEWKDGTLRLKGNNISLNNVDSHNFIMSYSLLGNTRWDITRRDADGLFANTCKDKAKNIIFINKVLSTYNALG